MTEPSPHSQTDVVIHGVQALIADGTLTPGARLPVEKDLADQLGVSRGSLREGVRALSALGVLETRQGAGTFVTALELPRLMGATSFWVGLQAGPSAVHAHTVRHVLELQSVQLAAARFSDSDAERAQELIARSEAALAADPAEHEELMRIDLDLHRLIAEASGNPVLAAMIDTLSTPTLETRWRGLFLSPRLHETHHQHAAIVAALVDHDPSRARAWMDVHLYGVENLLPQT